jgi:hypothetical protein
MSFWSAHAEHGGRPCELRTAQPPAVIALAEDDLGAVFDALLANVSRNTPAAPLSPSRWWPGTPGRSASS